MRVGVGKAKGMTMGRAYLGRPRETSVWSTLAVPSPPGRLLETQTF